MKTRFIHKGNNPTLMILASSKRSEKSFLETHMKKKIEDEESSCLIVDEAVWNVKPKETYSGKTFKVGIGNRFLVSEIIPDDHDIMPYINKGYKVIDVPVEFKEDFKDDIDRALCDFAGVSSSDLIKYISGQRLLQCKRNNYRNAFIKDVIEVGNAKEDIFQYYNFFDLERIDPVLKSRPMFIHLDMSLSGDKTGIAGVWILGKKPHIDGIPDSKELYYKVAFSVSIKPPKGYQVSFEKTRQFIYWLRDKGFNIRGVSSDTFQNADLAQQLKDQGFDYCIISVDRVNSESHVCEPYQYFKNSLYEERIELYDDCKLLTEEILGLEKNSSGKIDHPDEGRSGCFTEDTKISLVDGRDVSIKDLLIEQSYKTNYVYSFNEDKKIIEPKPILSVHQTKITKNLVKVTLDNGDVITCTPDHRFMLRDGSYEEIQNLSPGDSLMPLYRKYPNKGLSNYRMYYEPIENQWHYEHRRFASDVLDEKWLVHHKNFNSKNNNPTNLVWCSSKKHLEIHSKLSTGAQSLESRKKRGKSLSNYYKLNKNNPKFVARNIKISNTLSHLSEDDKNKLKLEKESRLLELKKKHDEKREKEEKRIREIEEIFNVKYDELSTSEKNSLGVKYRRLKDPSVQERISKAVSDNHKKGKYNNAYDSLSRLVWYTDGETNIYQDKNLPIPEGFYRGRVISKESIENFKLSCKNRSEEKKRELSNRLSESTSSLMWVTNGSIDKYIKKDSIIPDGFRKGRSKVGKNHKIISIERINKPCKVYDLTIKDNHNFALAAGVFVHNSKDQVDAVCGAIWNASRHSDEFEFEYGDTLSAITQVSGSIDNNIQSQITFDFEEELKKAHLFKSVDKQEIGLDFGKGRARKVDNSAFYLAQGIVCF